jgi:cholesterol oxidase
METHHKAIVVGSGFGGSVMAYRLARAKLEPLVLERGRRYAPGEFPRSPFRMKDLLWDPSEGLHGLLNVWRFRGINALVASGLGGGSLIYANVLLRKDAAWFVRRDPHGNPLEDWPVTRAELDRHYDSVERIIGVQRFPEHLHKLSPKTLVMKEAAARAGLPWAPAPLGITFPDPGAPPGEPFRPEAHSLHANTRSTCRLCGECDVGCNYGAKNTLDHNYLGLAQREGAQLRDRCEVRAFGRQAGRGYWVEYVQHQDDVRDTQALPVRRVTCERLILSAGALGSTFLLLKNREHLAPMSERLGTQFCGNGDFLGLALRATDPATGKRRHVDPSRGPVITSYVRRPDVADGGDGRGLYVEDAGYPEFLNWLVEAAQPLTVLRRALRYGYLILRKSLGHDLDTDLGSELSALFGDCSLSNASLPMLGMGRDVPDGRLFLGRTGRLDVDWRSESSAAFFERVRETMMALARGMGADYRDSPLRLLNRLITVHPLGGAPMGRTPADGAVDPHGEVFGNPGLFVADGAVLPGPVGANPSLTIAALADRFAERVIDRVAQA